MKSYKLPITLIVLTRNESDNIQRCLNSVDYCSEKLVIDSGSTDRTVELAKSCGARVIGTHWRGFGPQRNFAATQALNDWVLFLDADEEATAQLNHEIEQEFETKSKKFSVFSIRRNAMYMGKVMNYYSPLVGEVLPRMYNRQLICWDQSLVHEKLIFQKQNLFKLKSHIIHYHSSTLVHKQMKVLKYSELHALERLNKHQDWQIALLPIFYLLTLFKELFYRRAIFDGKRGIVVAHIAASYSCYKKIRRFEMQINPESIRNGKEILVAKNNWDQLSDA